MSRRPLSPDEHALWRRVVADVTPLRVVREVVPAVRVEPVEAPSSPAPPSKKANTPSVPTLASAVDRFRTIGFGTGAPKAKPAPRPANTLDGSWDRRLARGIVAPDRVVDLHGHTLAAAHATLDHALAAAVGDGDRVLLIVAGRDRPGPGRGAIRREVGDWLARSRHAARIAAIRAAHPRHGGAGAFYLILRRAG